MDDYGLVAGEARDGDRDGPACRFHGMHQSTQSSLLPVFTVMLLTGFDVRMFHHYKGRSRNRMTVAARLPGNQNPVASLKILKLQARGVLQIFFARRDAQNLSGRIDRDVYFGTRVRRQQDVATSDGFDRTDAPRDRSCPRRLCTSLRLT